MEPIEDVAAGDRGGVAGGRGRYGLDGSLAGVAFFALVLAGAAATGVWAARHRRPDLAALAGVAGAAVAGSAASYLYSTGPSKLSVRAQVLVSGRRAGCWPACSRKGWHFWTWGCTG